MTAGGRLDGGAEPLVRPIERLQQNLAISVRRCRRSQPKRRSRRRRDGSDQKRGYLENRRILSKGCRARA